MDVSKIGVSKIEVSIEKNIFQTWKTHDVPRHWKGSPKSIKKHMPGWRHILTSDEDNLRIVKKHFPKYLSAYLALPYPIQRADMIRPMLLYLYGGIYIDLDFVVMKPLDPLFRSGDLFFIPSGNTAMCITNSFMASRAKHPFWLEYLDDMLTPIPRWAYGKHLEVMTSTGPLRLTSTLAKSDSVYSVLPKDKVMPCSVCDINDFLCRGGYLRGTQGQSWNAIDSLIINFFLCNGKMVGLYLFVIIMVCWLIKRTTK